MGKRERQFAEVKAKSGKARSSDELADVVAQSCLWVDCMRIVKERFGELIASI
jgi:hypothetical protein